MRTLRRPRRGRATPRSSSASGSTRLPIVGALLAVLLIATLSWILSGSERASGNLAHPTADAPMPPHELATPDSTARVAAPGSPRPLVFEDDLSDHLFDEPSEAPPPVPPHVGSIEGTVRLNGELENAIVWCSPRGGWAEQVAYARNGAFRFDDVPVGTVDIEAAPAEWARGPGQLRIVGAVQPASVVEGEATSVELFLDAPERSFHGTVRHENGAPASGWQVYVSAARGPLSFRTWTDARGRFACDVPDVGLPYRAEAHAIGSSPVEAFPGEGVELSVSDLGDLVVRATDAETGESLTAFEVDLRLPESYWQRPPRPARPDPDGTFRWRTFVGMYDILVLAPGYATSEVRGVELSRSGATELDVLLAHH